MAACLFCNSRAMFALTMCFDVAGMQERVDSPPVLHAQNISSLSLSLRNRPQRCLKRAIVANMVALVAMR